MADNLKERIAKMKATAEAFQLRFNKCRWFTVPELEKWFTTDIAKYVVTCSPDSVLALIAEIERLERENLTMSLTIEGLIEVRDN